MKGYETISDKDVRIVFNNCDKESEDIEILEKFNKIVTRGFRTVMRNSNAIARKQNLFTTYHTVLVSNRLKSTIEEKHEVTVKYIIHKMRT